jgi:hypothetical protein
LVYYTVRWLIWKWWLPPFLNAYTILKTPSESKTNSFGLWLMNFHEL